MVGPCLLVFTLPTFVHERFDYRSTPRIHWCPFDRGSKCGSRLSKPAQFCLSGIGGLAPNCDQVLHFVFRCLRRRSDKDILVFIGNFPFLCHALQSHISKNVLGCIASGTRCLAVGLLLDAVSWLNPWLSPVRLLCPVFTSLGLFWFCPSQNRNLFWSVQTNVFVGGSSVSSAPCLLKPSNYVSSKFTLILRTDPRPGCLN